MKSEVKISAASQPENQTCDNSNCTCENCNCGSNCTCKDCY